MAVNSKQTQQIAIFGALAGVATPFLLKYVVMPILNFLGGIVPQLSLKLAENPGTIEANIRASLTGINAGLAEWLVNALGITVNVPFQTYIMAAVGGALLFLAGAYILDGMKALGGNAEQKTRKVIFAGSIVAALILGTMGLPPEIGLTLVNVLIAIMINAAILAWVYVAIDKQMKLGLIPF